LKGGENVDTSFERILGSKSQVTAERNVDEEILRSRAINNLANSDKYLSVTGKGVNSTTAICGSAHEVAVMLHSLIGDLRKSGMPDELIVLSVVTALKE